MNKNTVFEHHNYRDQLIPNTQRYDGYDPNKSAWLGIRNISLLRSNLIDRIDLELEEFMKHYFEILVSYIENVDDLSDENIESITSFSDSMTHADWYAMNELKTTYEKERKSYVYFIYDPINKTVKIGKSNNPKQRLSSLKCGNSNSLELTIVEMIECKCASEAYDIESMIHRFFKYYRVSKTNEWFKFPIEYIQTGLFRIDFEAWKNGKAFSGHDIDLRMKEAKEIIITKGE